MTGLPPLPPGFEPMATELPPLPPGFEPIQPGQSPGKMGTARDMLQSAGTGLAKTGIAMAGAPGDFAAWLGDKRDEYITNPIARKFGWKELPTGGAIEQDPARMVGSEPIGRAVKSITGEFHKPETKLGEVSETAGGFLPNLVGGPLSGMRLVWNGIKYVAAPTAAVEAVGHVTKGSKYEEPAKAAAGLVTTGGAALLSRPAYADRLMGNAARNVTPQQFDQAYAGAVDSAGRGIQLAPTESIQQATGGATRLGDVQRLAESTTEGGARLAPFFAERPAQMQAATEQSLNQIAPRSQTPSFVGREAQEAATGAIEQTRQQINRLAEPFYQAAAPVPIPAAEYARFMALPGYPEALATVRNTPQLNRYVANLPDQSVGVLNEVKKQLNQAADNAGAVVNPHRNVQVPAGYRSDARDVTQTGRNLSPEYGQALDIEAAGRQRVLGPLQSGPARKIASTDDIAAQGGALINNVNSPQEVERALANIMRQNPAAARSVVREELGRTADRTVGGMDSAARPDQFGGAKMVKQIQGDARQAENFQAALNAIGGPAAQDVPGLLNSLQATGWRNRPGSLTAFNQESLRDMERGGAQGAIQAFAGPFKQARDTAARWRLGSQSERLAEILMSGPEGVRRIQEAAASGNDAARLMMARILMSGNASTANKRIEPRP